MARKLVLEEVLPLGNSCEICPTYRVYVGNVEWANGSERSLQRRGRENIRMQTAVCQSHCLVYRDRLRLVDAGHLPSVKVDINHVK